ncbi:MAG: carboxypeptidase regulatory-like domain-containing protein [Terriglobales bacterium]
MPRPSRLRASVICLAVCVFLIRSALVQTSAKAPGATPSQNILVTVVDENDVAVTSALVFLQASPEAVALRSVTDFAGHCEFSNLSATSYQLRVEKQGFYSVTLTLPAVQTGTASNVEVTLTHQQEVRQVVNVVESPPAIDPAQVSDQEQLTGVDIINLPYPDTRDYRNALNFIPGVVNDVFGQPHIAGSETYQTLTLLDGFNVTQPATGELLMRVSPDSLRSVDVEASRNSAEYGKGSGGVLSLNTGIGDDHFRYAGTNFVPSVQNKKGLAFDKVDPRFAFSGPIRKGKMWFFDSPDGEYDNIVITELPNGADSDRLWRVGNLAKVQTNLSARDILTTSFNLNHLHDDHEGLSAINPVEATPSDIESAYLASVKNQYYFQGGELLETGAAFLQYNLELTPAGTQPYFTSPEITGGNYYLFADTRARRWQGLVNLYLPPKQWHGQHEVKMGIDTDRLIYHADFQRTPISFLREGQQPLSSGDCLTVMPTFNPCSRYSVFSGGANSAADNLETSGYIQDRWLATNRLLIEPGLRFDWDDLIRSPLVSPRLAGTYVLDSKGNTKLSAGVGTVYDATNLLLVARPSAGERTDTFFDSSGNSTGSVLTTFSANTHILQEPRYLNWSLGLEQKLPGSIYLKAQFLQRNGTHGLVYNTANGLPGGDFILENTRDDRYHSFEVNLRRAFRHRYSVFGSYTRSSSRSNQVLDFNVDNPILSPQAAGPYSWDAPNRFLSWGLVPFFKLPIIHELDIAYSLEGRSGFPFNVTNEQGQLVGSPGTLRFPTYFALNLFVEKRFHAFGRDWALRGGFENITDHANPAVVNADSDSTQFGTFSNFQGRAFTTRIRLIGKK